MSIDIKGISKTFGKQKILSDIHLSVPEGKMTVLLGPSGSGKTTLLRILGGLEYADKNSGQVYFHGQEVTQLPPAAREAGFVFQHYALFKHMTVFENIAFGLRVKPRKQRLPNDEINKKVLKLLELIQLPELKDRYPFQLSGGQRQRVALARAIATQPKVLLLDEPFGALDAKVRKDLRKWLVDFHHEVNVTSILVTHDQEEALEIADQIAVLSNGRIEQQGPPQDIYHNPANPFVCQFIGEVNILPERFFLNGSPAPGPGGDLYLRPHEIEISATPTEGSTPTTLLSFHIGGPHIRLIVHSQKYDRKVEVQIPPGHAIAQELVSGKILYLTPRITRTYKTIQ